MTCHSLIFWYVSPQEPITIICLGEKIKRIRSGERGGGVNSSVGESFPQGDLLLKQSSGFGPWRSLGASWELGSSPPLPAAP